MSVDAPHTPRVRPRFLLGVTFVAAVVLVGLFVFGRRSTVSAEAPAAGQRSAVASPSAKVFPRSAAHLQLDEAKNVRPDAPEVTSTSLQQLDGQVYPRMMALAQEMQVADPTRLFGLSARAEETLDAMMKEPRFRELETLLKEQERRWVEADMAERQEILKVRRAAYDELLAEARVRLSALR